MIKNFLDPGPSKTFEKESTRESDSAYDVVVSEAHGILRFAVNLHDQTFWKI